MLEGIITQTKRVQNELKWGYQCNERLWTSGKPRFRYRPAFEDNNSEINIGQLNKWQEDNIWKVSYKDEEKKKVGKQ